MLQKRIDDQPTISREMIREAEQILHRHLKRVGLKHTAQRDTILRTFLETSFIAWCVRKIQRLGLPPCIAR